MLAGINSATWDQIKLNFISVNKFPSAEFPPSVTLVINESGLCMALKPKPHYLFVCLLYQYWTFAFLVENSAATQAIHIVIPTCKQPADTVRSFIFR